MALNTYGMMSEEAANAAGYSQRDLDTMRATAIRNQQQRAANPLPAGRRLSLGQPQPGDPMLMPIPEGGFKGPPLEPPQRIVIKPDGTSDVIDDPGMPASANPAYQDYWSPEMSGPTFEEYTLQMGDGGQGVAPIDWGGTAAPDVPLTGFESSTNRPLYQQQFAAMRSQALRRQAAEQAARDRAATPPAPVAADPWSWANLPQRDASTGMTNRPVEYELNPRFDWSPQTTNAQIISDLGSVLNTDEQAMINKHMGTPGVNWDTSTFWAGAPKDTVWQQTFGGSNAQDPNWTNVLQKVLGNVHTPVGGGLQGAQAPPGYVAPR